jgi:hypothetical protein
MDTSVAILLADSYRLMGLGRDAEALPLLRQLESLSWGMDRDSTGSSLSSSLAHMVVSSLRACLQRMGKNDEVLPLLRRAMQRASSELGPLHDVTLMMMDDLSDYLEDEGRFSDALLLSKQYLDATSRKHGPEHL